MADQKQWLIEMESGQVVGPLTTREVFIKIAQAQIMGEERISEYPGGDWQSLSHRVEFYDFLIDVISGKDVTIPEEGQEFSSAASEPTIIFEAPEGGSDSVTDEPNEKDDNVEAQVTKRDHTNSVDESEQKEDSKEFRRRSITSLRDKSAPKENPFSVGQTKNFENQNNKDFKKSSKEKKSSSVLGPVIILIAGVALISGYFLTETSSVTRSAEFILPKFKKKNIISREKAGQFLEKANSYFYQDSLPTYLISQKLFSSLLEKNFTYDKAFAHLCLSYWYAWPHVNHSSANLKVVSRVKDVVNRLHASESGSVVCSVVYDFMRGYWGRAQQKVDLALRVYSDNPSPLIYYLKAQILLGQKKNSAALGYIREAQRLLVRWVRLFYSEALILTYMGNSTEAAVKYRTILESRPQHVLSRLHLALLEYFKFNRPNVALKLITQAHDQIQEGAPVPNTVLSESYFVLGENYRKQKNNEEALKNYVKAYELDPTRNDIAQILTSWGYKLEKESKELKSKLLVSLGDNFSRQKLCKAAQPYFKSAFETDPKNGIAALKLSKCYWDLGLSGEAVDALEKSIKADPRIVDSYVTLSKYHTKRYDYSKAKLILGRASSIFQNNEELLRAYIDFYISSHSPEAALKMIRVLEGYSVSQVDAFVYKAESLLMLAKYSDAFVAISKALEEDTVSPKIHVIYARVLFYLRGTGKSISYLSKKVDEYPLEIEYRLALAKIFLKSEKYEQAKDLLIRVTKLNGRSKEAWIALGEAYQGLNAGDAGQGPNSLLNRAQEAFLKAAIIDPSDLDSVFKLGVLYLGVNKPKQAVDYFQKVSEVNQKYPNLQHYLGYTYLSLNEFNKALIQAELGARINPAQVESYELLGQIYLRSGNYKLCTQNYRKVISLRAPTDPNNANTYVALSICYRNLGNLDVARSMLTEAQQANSSFPDVYRELGMILAEEGQGELAYQAFEKYLKLKPNALDSFEVRGQMKRLSQ